MTPKILTEFRYGHFNGDAKYGTVLIDEIGDFRPISFLSFRNEWWVYSSVSGCQQDTAVCNSSTTFVTDCLSTQLSVFKDQGKVPDCRGSFSARRGDISHHGPIHFRRRRCVSQIRRRLYSDQARTHSQTLQWFQRRYANDHLNFCRVLLCMVQMQPSVRLDNNCWTKWPVT